MSCISYMKILYLIKEVFELRYYIGNNIPTELKLKFLIRLLSGGSYLDVGDVVLIRSSSLYCFSYSCVSEILNFQSLNITLPITNKYINSCCMGYNSCSSHNSILGFLCIDGYLFHMCEPPNEEVGNFNDYFSGRYNKYGINSQ